MNPRLACRLAGCRHAAMNILKTVLLIVSVALSAPLPVLSAGKWDGMYREAKAMFDGKKTAEALICFNRLVDVLESPYSNLAHSDSVLLMNAYTYSGRSNVILGNKAAAMNSYKAAVGIAERLGDKPQLGRLYNNLFAIYYSSREFESASGLLDMSLELCKESGDSAGMCNIYNNKGLVALEQADYEAAFGYMRRALDYAPKHDMQAVAPIYTNMAEAYFRQGRYHEAERMLAEAVRIGGGKADTPEKLQARLNMALVKTILGKHREVARMEKDIYPALDGMPLPVRVNSYRQLAEINFIAGDSLAGLRDILIHEQLADSVENGKDEAYLQELLVEYDAERLKQSNSILSQNVRMRGYMLYGSVAFAVLLLLMLALLFRRMRNDRRKNALIDEQRRRLLRYEHEEHERQQRELSLEIDHKNRQLTSYSMELISVNEYHRKLEEELQSVRDEVKAGDADAAERGFSDIIRGLRHFSTAQVSEEFRVFFEKVHPHFVSKLSSAHPNLSSNDLRLCTYLYLNMSTKEIASLTCREVRSVESSRNRLRKKLELGAGEDITKYLKSLV